MEVAIKIDQATLTECGITVEQFRAAACYALGNLSHPDTGVPIFFNSVGVTVSVSRAEINLADVVMRNANVHIDLKPLDGLDSVVAAKLVGTVVNQVVESEQQIRERIKLLSDEMDANDEENRDMQREIDSLYARIDARLLETK